MPIFRDNIEQLISFCNQQGIINVEIMAHETDLIVDLSSGINYQNLDKIFYDASSVSPDTGYYHVDSSKYDKLYTELSSLAFNSGLTIPKSRVSVHKRFLDKEIVEQQANKRFRTNSSSSHSSDSDVLSSSSSGSDIETKATRVLPILITGSANLEEIEGKNRVCISFHVPDSRGVVNLPENSQGSHTTSYITIIRAILQCVDDNTISSAIEDIRGFGQSVLKEGLGKFNKIMHPIILIEGEKRKKIKKIVTAHINDSDGQDINLIIKHSKATQLTNHLANLTSCLLTELQREDLTTFYSKGRMISRPAGDTEKGAAYALTMLNQLCKLCKMKNEDLAEELPIFIQGLKVLSKADKKPGEAAEDHMIRYGLNRFYPTDKRVTDSGEKADNTRNNLIDVETLQEQREILLRLKDDLLEKKDLIAQFQGDLLDYNRQLVFNLAEVTENDLKKHFPENSHSYDVEWGRICKITRNKDTDLIKIISRHLHVISVAFPDLHSNLKSNDKLYEIQAKFLEQEILTKQGWQNYQYENDNGDLISLDKKYLETQISEFSKQPSEPTR